MGNQSHPVVAEGVEGRSGVMERVVAQNADVWPPLPLEQWKDTCGTLHMWTQIVGKIRLALTPLINHWWNVPLYVNARGLTTSPIPYSNMPFELSFDFLDHQLVLHVSGGLRKVFPLTSMSVSDFHKEVMRMLLSSGIEVKIWRMPVEVPDPNPVRRGSCAYYLRSRSGAEVLENSAERTVPLRRIQVEVPWQMQPHSFLLG
jgi:hypothetical protein